MTDKDLIRRKLKIYASIIEANHPDIDKKAIMKEMLKLAFKLGES